MSSTNRGGNRHASDYYVTPVKDIIHFLTEYFNDYQEAGFSGRILDPCAGGDNNNPMSYPEAITSFVYCPNPTIETIDIRSDSYAGEIGDYLKMDCNNKYDIIITNPPFYLAQEIIEKALNDVKTDGRVIMLLRLNFFGSVKRLKFWRGRMHVYTYVHSNRMSFTSDGKTDSIEYMHCIWIKGQNNKTTILKVI